MMTWKYWMATLTALAVAAMLITQFPAKAQQAQKLDVDLALVIVVDASESIDDNEFALQEGGIATAFADPEIINAIKGGAIGRIAISVVEFSDEAKIVVPWKVIDSADTAKAFAADLLNAPRVGRDNTSISSGLILASTLIAGSPYRATRRVVDISGDGSNNSDNMVTGTSLENARALAAALKITVNGLPIASDTEDVEGFYRENVIMGPGSFLIPAADFRDFARAIRRKLVREIS